MKSKFVIWGLLVLMASSVLAVPAYRGPLTHVQSDGSKITLYQHGDECFSYFTNEAGQWLQADEKGDFRIVPAMSDEQIAMRRAESRYANSALRRAASETGIDRTLSPRGPVILVNFADTKFSSTNAQMTEWAMGSNYSYNGATGSIHQYFKDVSYGEYDLQLDVFGPVTVSKNFAYYGGDYSTNYRDTCADKLVVEACQQAIKAGADFSQYDDDKDGYVDWVVIIYAGKGQADGGVASTIWPHQYDLHYYGSAFKLNGKTIDHYCMLCELNGQTGERAGIGTFVHEFSHIMGLPDLYETTGQGNWKTSGMWDVMDYGPYNNDGNTPPAYSAYERWFMGWLSPTLLKQAATPTLLDLNTTRSAAYINASGAEISDILRPNPTQFYILENRQQSGWDAYIPGHGLLITRINYRSAWWGNNSVNNSKSNLGVDIIEADGVAPTYVKGDRENGYFGKLTDAYPHGATSFTTLSAYQITNITEADKKITFDLNGGGESTILQAIEHVTSQQQSNIKWLRNGLIIIQRGNDLYDISGKRIN